MELKSEIKEEILSIVSQYVDLDRLVILAVVGSHMYGTDTEDSDYDLLGVYVPTKNELIMNNVKDHISIPKHHGYDAQIWSIYKFFNLACQGETLAIDLLHAPVANILKSNFIWNILLVNKKSFYTKGMTAFVSYSRKQAAKYGIKGTRIETIEKVVEFLEGFSEHDRLKNVWDTLPKDDHIHFLDGNPRMYQVTGVKFQETIKISYILENLKKKLTEYGDRAIKARNNEGVDWKAISHAIRGAIQVRDILREGDFQYPLREAEFIKNVKLGKLDFESVVQPYLDEKMKYVEELMLESDLPEKVNQQSLDYLLTYIIERSVL